MLDTIEGATFNPKQPQRGAPPTAEIEAQMGTQSYALYRPPSKPLGRGPTLAACAMFRRSEREIEE